MKKAQKMIAVILAVLTACAVLSPMASAKAVDKKGIVADPSVTTFVYSQDGKSGTYCIDIHTGNTVTLRMVDSSGNQVKVPKGCHVKWAADPYPTGSSYSGKVRLTPSADGSTCTLKATKGGRDAAIIATIYDKNGKEVNWYLGFVQSRYTAPEWIAFYLTLGMYGINWENMLRFDDLNSFLFNLVDIPVTMLLQPIELLSPWDMFYTYY